MRISDWSSDVCSSDLRVFEHALDVILRLEDRDRLDPVEDGDGPRARVAVGAQPFVHIARPGVVGGDGERIAAAIIAEHLPEIGRPQRSEEHTSELQSLMRIPYAVFCLKKKTPEQYNSIHPQ